MKTNSFTSEAGADGLETFRTTVGTFDDHEIGEAKQNLVKKSKRSDAHYISYSIKGVKGMFIAMVASICKLQEDNPDVKILIADDEKPILEDKKIRVGVSCQLAPKVSFGREGSLTLRMG